ncbi:uncharacterized protein TNCV_4047431 [Trichonephila clavipes]|nr:uncharacterized protein TNCV_4047431 [Trichonephila clavipes]
MLNTSGYNLRPRNGRRVESRPSMEMKIQQGGPVRARNSKGKNCNPYIEEQARLGNMNTRRRGSQQNDLERKGGANTHRSISLSNRNARRRGDQQWEEQERKGASTRRSLSLEVLARNANYKS